MDKSGGFKGGTPPAPKGDGFSDSPLSGAKFESVKGTQQVGIQETVGDETSTPSRRSGK